MKKEKSCPLEVTLIPIFEDKDAFEKRSDEIRDLIAKMILIGEKEGRTCPKSFHEENEFGSTLQCSEHL